MELKVGKEPWLKAAAFYLRMNVFVIEQGIPLEDEFEDHEDKNHSYVVLFDGDTPVSTGRYLKEGNVLRPQRVCTHIDYRGQKHGEKIIAALEELGKENGCTSSLIHGDLEAINFYHRLGYETVSDVYYEDGRGCVNLEKAL